MHLSEPELMADTTTFNHELHCTVHETTFIVFQQNLQHQYRIININQLLSGFNGGPPLCGKEVTPLSMQTPAATGLMPIHLESFN